MKILLRLVLPAVLAAGVLTTVLTVPASGQPHRVTVLMPDGSAQSLVIDVAPGTTLEQLDQLPGRPVSLEPLAEEEAQPTERPPAEPPPPPPPADSPPAGGAPPDPSAGNPKSVAPAPGGRPAPGGSAAAPGGSGRTESSPSDDPEVRKRRGATDERRDGRARRKSRRRLRRDRTPLRNPDGTPARSNPGFVDALPGPLGPTGVPNFLIRKFRVPIFLLPIYQAAGTQYAIQWEILAAINEIETDYGRNLNVSSAGAVGWMQFLPSSWRMYGVDANRDGRKDPYNPVDAIFAAARYLKAAGYEKDVRRAIFAYNHADWYVDSVMLRARLIAGVPAELVGSLTGLTEGRFPVHARAMYANDVRARGGLRPGARRSRGIEIFTRKGAPAVAVNDGVIRKVGRSARFGRYVILEDVYGNRYLYGQLGSVASDHPVPDAATRDTGRSPGVSKAHAGRDPEPSAPASAGRQSDRPPSRSRGAARRPRASAPTKERLFAHPYHSSARRAGGLHQLAEPRTRKSRRTATFEAYSSRPFGVGSKDVRASRLKKGSRVVAGSILGRVGYTVDGKAPHLYFEIRPAGRGAPRIDPKPILDGWRLLEATAIHRASGRNVLSGENLSIGEILLLPKPLLERRVVSDERIEVYSCGRRDIRAGLVDRRVLTALAYLAESGLRPTVSSLQCGHSFFTKSGGVSQHSSGNAVDISKINGIPVGGHQERGGVVEQAVRQLLRLQGSMRPDQIISLLDLGDPTLAMADHADHLHLGFRPRFGGNARLGAPSKVLRRNQWALVVDRLRAIENPLVPVGHLPGTARRGRSAR